MNTENNWIYHRNNSRFRCLQYRICPVRLRVMRGIYIQNGEHTHANQWQDITNFHFENEFKEIVRVRPGELYKRII